MFDPGWAVGRFYDSVFGPACYMLQQDSLQCRKHRSTGRVCKQDIDSHLCLRVDFEVICVDHNDTTSILGIKLILFTATHTSMRSMNQSLDN
jgi:hypothetical protein